VGLGKIFEDLDFGKKKIQELKQGKRYGNIS